MSRKKFIEENGATCNNWRQSWSFINLEKKKIIFGAWDDPNSAGVELIFTYDWEYNHKNQKLKAFKQSREHIRLIEEEGFELYTFKMYYSDANRDDDGNGPAKIDGFERKLSKKHLYRDNLNWYAVDFENDISIAEEIIESEESFEGRKITVSVNSYERNASARQKCLDHHGYSCKICGFNFEKFYGVAGANYIHVHHITPLYKINKEYSVCPINDLVPVCANCHSIIHRGRKTMSLEALTEHINRAKFT